MSTVDRAALLAFLTERVEGSRSPLIQAVYYGLAERVRRGDFTPGRES